MVDEAVLEDARAEAARTSTLLRPIIAARSASEPEAALMTVEGQGWSPGRPPSAALTNHADEPQGMQTDPKTFFRRNQQQKSNNNKKGVDVARRVY